MAGIDSLNFFATPAEDDFNSKWLRYFEIARYQYFESLRTDFKVDTLDEIDCKIEKESQRHLLQGTPIPDWLKKLLQFDNLIDLLENKKYKELKIICKSLIDYYKTYGSVQYFASPIELISKLKKELEQQLTKDKVTLLEVAPK